jgi:hypothetical protein
LLGVVLGLVVVGCGGGSGDKPPINQPLPIERTDAAGGIDTSFGMQGLVTLRGSRSDSTISEIVSLADGRYLVGGHGPYIARLMPDGSLDPSFATAGIDTTSRGTRFFQDVVKIAQLPDGRAIVVENHYSPCFGSGFFCASQSFADVVARRIDAKRRS